MCNNIELEFTNAGIGYKVEVIEEDRSLDTVVSVSVWDGKQYIEVDADTELFKVEMEDILNEEIDEYYVNLRLRHEDMMYDMARDEGRL